MSAKDLLIDVRTPGEFSTGALQNALNIEYQLIDSHPIITSLDKSTPITLYCRSGRRSDIALRVLKELGYSNVRDIGGLEEARMVMKREEMLRGLKMDGEGEVKGEKGKEERKEAREKSLEALLLGLRGEAET